MRRIVVVGSSSSGKTTVAATIAETVGLPHLELDSVMHRGGWDHATVHRLRSPSRVKGFLASLGDEADM